MSAAAAATVTNCFYLVYRHGFNLCCLNIFSFKERGARYTLLMLTKVKIHFHWWVESEIITGFEGISKNTGKQSKVTLLAFTSINSGWLLISETSFNMLLLISNDMAPFRSVAGRVKNHTNQFSKSSWKFCSRFSRWNELCYFVHLLNDSRELSFRDSAVEVP